MKLFSRAALPALLVILLAACDSGSSDSAENIVTDPPAPPEDGINGRVSSRISGATITVQDATGSDIVIDRGRTTSSNGAYSLIFSEFEVNDCITPPLVVTVDGSGATATCDFNGEGDNDCLAADGTSVAFGETYTLPDGYILRGVAPTFPPQGSSEKRTVTVNVSPASELAVTYALAAAGGAPLTEADVNIATAQALGAVEFVTALSVDGMPINTIPILNVTSPSSLESPALALALYGASLNGQVDREGLIPSYTAAMARVSRRIVAGNDGALTTDGTFGGIVAGTFIIAGNSLQASLGSPLASLAGALASQNASLPYFSMIGNATLPLSLPADPDSGAALDEAKRFVTRLSEVGGGTLIISNVNGIAGTASGAGQVFSDQLSIIARLVGQEVRDALLQLDVAIADAFANGETTLSGTNVSGLLSFEGDVVTMETTTSAITNIQTGILVNITIPNGTRNNPGGDGTFAATEFTMSISQTQNDVATQELYEGTLTLDMKAAESGADLNTISFLGATTAIGGLTFTSDINIADLTPQGEINGPAGDFETTMTFNEGSMLSLMGQLQNQLDMYTSVVGSSTIVADLVANKITDMVTDLNLQLDAGAVIGGELRSSGEVTGSMDATGIVSFSDGTVEVLPAPVL